MSNDEILKNKIEKIKQLIELDELEEAHNEGNEMLENVTNKCLLSELETNFKRLGDSFQKRGPRGHLDAISCYSKAIRLRKNAYLYVKRGELFFLMDKLEESLEDVNKALLLDHRSIEGRILKLKILEEMHANVSEMIEEALRIHDLQPTKDINEKLGLLYFSQGLENINLKNTDAAFESLSKSLIYIVNPGSVYKERAFIAYALKNYATSLKDCSEAINSDFDTNEIRILRAKCYLKHGKLQEAYKDASTAYERIPNIQYLTFLVDVANVQPKSSQAIQQPRVQRVQITEQHKKSETYYTILGVNTNATIKEIRKRYLKLCLKYHPDKLRKSTELERLKNGNKFKNIVHCYNVLSDPISKRQYDKKLML